MASRIPPDILYLQFYEMSGRYPDTPYSPVDEVTWCVDKINKSDVEYLLATPERRAAPDLLRELERARDGYLNLVEMGILHQQYADAAMKYAEGMRVAIQAAKGKTNDQTVTDTPRPD